MTCLQSILATIVFLIILLPTATAQKKENETREIEFARELKVNFIDTYHKKVLLPFKNIIVWDYRFDSSKIGYVAEGIGKSRYQKIQLETAWSELLNNYFKKNLDQSSSHSLLIVIRNFWMQKGIIDELTTKKVVKKEWLGSPDYYGQCKADMDIFILSDSFLHAIFKIEGTFFTARSFNSLYLNEWVFLPFDSLAKRIITYDLLLLGNKKKLSIDEVASFYKKRFELPILADTDIKKGIFKTFEDFKKNKPFEVEMKIVKGEVTDELYMIENGTESIVGECWGFCNGKELYIRSAFNFFPAIRQQNSFELFGAKFISNFLGQGKIGNIRYYADYMKVQRKILQINMENGKLY